MYANSKTICCFNNIEGISSWIPLVSSSQSNICLYFFGKYPLKLMRSNKISILYDDGAHCMINIRYYYAIMRLRCCRDKGSAKNSASCSLLLIQLPSPPFHSEEEERNSDNRSFYSSRGFPQWIIVPLSPSRYSLNVFCLISFISLYLLLLICLFLSLGWRDD